MAKQKETRFKEKVLKDLRKLPCSWFCKIQQRSIRGTPDILGTVCGFFVAIELKDKDARPDPSREKLQDHKLEEIAAAGGIAAKVTQDTWPEVFAQLRKVVEQHQFDLAHGPAKEEQH